MKGSSSVFVANGAPGRWGMPGQSTFGFDFLIVISVALIAAVLTVVTLARVPSASQAAFSWMDSAKTRAIGIASSAPAPPSSIADSLIAQNPTGGSIRFDPMILSHGIDGAQNPIGATASFSESDIRAKGIGAFLRFVSTAATKPQVEIKWSSLAYSGSSRLRSLPNSAPFFLRLGNSFPPGTYHFWLVVDGVAKQSTDITIHP